VRFVKTLIIALLVLFVIMVGVTFSIHNTEKVVIDLIFIQLPEASLSLWLIAAFVLGGFIGVILSVFTILVLKTRLGSAKRKVSSAQKEIDNLRVSNLKDAI